VISADGVTTDRHAQDVDPGAGADSYTIWFKQGAACRELPFEGREEGSQLSGRIQRSQGSVHHGRTIDMNPMLIGVVVFIFTFGGALLGLWLRSRLPADHVTDATKDTVKLGVGLVATMTAWCWGW
jgi:hypothetical protein